jgi:starvation-inducible outer membrane lipoprotein
MPRAFLLIVVMKGGAAMKLILALSGALLVAGCSSLPMQVAENDSPMVCDRALMERIEGQAQAARAEIRWVNCPQIRRDRVKIVS